MKVNYFELELLELLELLPIILINSRNEDEHLLIQRTMRKLPDGKIETGWKVAYVREWHTIRPPAVDNEPDKHSEIDKLYPLRHQGSIGCECALRLRIAVINMLFNIEKMGYKQPTTPETPLETTENKEK